MKEGEGRKEGWKMSVGEQDVYVYSRKNIPIGLLKPKIPEELWYISVCLFNEISLYKQCYIFLSQREKSQ